MLKQSFFSQMKIRLSTALANVILIANVFVWYTYASAVLKGIVEGAGFTSFETVMFYTVSFCGAIVSMLVGAFVVDKFLNRSRFLLIWTLIGMGSSALAFLSETATIANVSILSFLFGVSFGLGLPACMGYFAESTVPENRARFGAIMLLSMFLGMFIFRLVVTASTAVIFPLILVCWRALGLVALPFIDGQKERTKEKASTSFVSILRERSFFLYLIPWIVFSLVNYLSWTILDKIHGGEFVYSFALAENVLAGLFALVAGFTSDAVGRKRTLVFGFIMLGLGYAVLGIYPSNILAWYFYTLVDGIAWGIIYVIFFFTIWGDLAHEKPSEKYYALGVLPYSLSSFLRVTIGPIITSAISEYAIFSFAAFFLFLAVIPLMYAPETLPEKHIKERELKIYIEDAKKVKEKYT
jgi:MFS family permease